MNVPESLNLLNSGNLLEERMSQQGAPSFLESCVPIPAQLSR